MINNFLNKLLNYVLIFLSTYTVNFIKCKAGLLGKCKLICTLVIYVNYPESGKSKTRDAEKWGKHLFNLIVT